MGSSELSLILSGLYPITVPAAHSLFSAGVYILLGTAFGFSVPALRYHPRCPRWLLFLGAVTALTAMLYGVFHTVTALEWATTALFLGYLGLLGVQTKRLSAPPGAYPAPPLPASS